jgi:tRNA G26 N,N-dimethylase Trm1
MKRRKGLEAISSKGYHRSQRVINALILLSGDAGEHQMKYSKYEDIARVLNISTKKIERVKKRFVEEGFDVAVDGHKSKHIYEKKADGSFEAHLIAMSCGKRKAG